MIALDSNVLVRLLTRDDPRQADLAAEAVRGRDVWIAKTTLLEVAWVLRSAYGQDEAEVAAQLLRVVSADRVVAEDPGGVRRALTAVRDHGLDLADALHRESSEPASRLLTFDRRFARASRGHAGPVEVDLLD